MRARIEQLDVQHDVHIYEARVSDLDAIAENCKYLAETGQTGTDDFRHLGDVPTFVCQKYMNENGVSWSEFLRNPIHATRLLNDPQYAKFRIAKGRV